MRAGRLGAASLDCRSVAAACKCPAMSRMWKCRHHDSHRVWRAVTVEAETIALRFTIGSKDNDRAAHSLFCKIFGPQFASYWAKRQLIQSLLYNYTYTHYSLGVPKILNLLRGQYAFVGQYLCKNYNYLIPRLKLSF